MRKLHLFVVLGSILLFSCESDEVKYRNLELKTDIGYHNVGTVFRNIPVEFSCELIDSTKTFPDFDVTWYTGDGNSVNERTFSYTYSENGIYTPYAVMYDGVDKYTIGEKVDEYWGTYYEISFIVRDYPTVIGEDGVNERGKFIYENGSDYSVIYTTGSGTREELYLMVVDDTFNEIQKKKLNVNSPSEIITSFRNNNDGIVIIAKDYFYEFSLSGDLIQKISKTKDYNSVINITNGYSAVAIENNNLRVDDLNLNFGITDSRLIQNQSDSVILDVSQYNINEYYVLFSETSTSSGSKHIRKLNNEGEIDLSFRIVASSILKINKFNDDLYVICESDESYKVYYSDNDYDYNYFEVIEYPGKYYKLDSTLQASIKLLGGNNGNSVVFYFSMGISGINDFPQGFYGTWYDAFNDAIKNDAGHYIMLGTKNDIINEEAAVKEYNTDLLLIELNGNGESVKKK